MITALALVILAVAAWRGYRRGAPGELIDLLVVALGFPIAFRLGAPLGEFLFSGWSPLIGRTVGALIIFGLLSVFGAAIGRAAAPSSEPEDPVIGAVLGAVRGCLMIVIVVAIVASAPGSSALGRAGQRSAVVELIGNPSGPAMQLFSAATGEEGMLALITFNRAFPDGPLVGDDFRQIPAFDETSLEPAPAAGAEILSLVNDERANTGLSELGWSGALTDVAEVFAREMYEGGFFAHVSARSGDVGDRLHAARIRFTIAGENLALAPTVGSVHRGLMNSPGHRANILHPEFTHIGIGAVEGPARTDGGPGVRSPLRVA